jgi:predicted RNA binding protein YcfA (HicA-like mRNA interferase family)
VNAARLPLCSSKQVIAAFTRMGFVEAHKRGSHLTMTRAREAGRRQTVVVMMGKREIPRGTLRKELKREGIPVEEFIDALRG